MHETLPYMQGASAMVKQVRLEHLYKKINGNVVQRNAEVSNITSNNNVL